MQKRAVGYVRQSSEKQEDNTSGATQEAKLREYIDGIGYACIGVEHEIQSGIDGLDARPILQKILGRMRSGEIDALVVYMVGRATRAGGIYALFLAHQCNEAGAELHFANDGGKVDITTLVGQLTLLLKGDQAKEERNHLLEAMERGRRARPEKLGLPIIGGHARFGYEYLDGIDPNTGRVRRKSKVVVREMQATIVRRIFQMYSEGMSCFAIAARLNEEKVPTSIGGFWEKTTVKNIIRDTRYIGIGYAYMYKRERLGYKRYKQTVRPVEERVRLPDGFWPAIVDKDIFYTCQERMDRAASESTRHNLSPELYLLRGGFVICGVCGYAMVCHAAHGLGKVHGSFPRYVCVPRPTNMQCPHPTIAAHYVDDAVKDKIRHLANNPEEVDRHLVEVSQDEGSTLERDLETAQKVYAQIKEREKRYIRLLDLPIDHEQEQEMHVTLQSLAAQRKEAESEVRRYERLVEAQYKSQQKITNVCVLLQRIAVHIDSATYEEWRDICRVFGVLASVFPREGYAHRIQIKMDIPFDWDEEASIANTSTYSSPSDGSSTSSACSSG